ncbi:MAG TPA: B12-binding domain-containing radical SAM protein [Clostridia bacterium]|nr:B12-binding domain-containing radical SAM protein [Clostridia bacterium]
MRVLLVNPGAKSVYTRLGLVFPPLGLAYVAAVARMAGHEVKILDLQVERPDLSRFEWNRYDVVGISTDTCRYPEALKVAKIAKDAGDTVVVMGGYHATFMDQDVLDTGVVDYVIRGEGELPFVELLECLCRKGNPSQVRGVSFGRGESFRRTDPAPLVRDIDRLPYPARDLLQMSRYRSRQLEGRNLTTLVSSRGCPHACSFCASSVFSGRNWRPRSAKSVVDEVEQIVRQYGFGAVAFMDDNFTLNPGRVIDICKVLIERGLDLRWWCFSRADTIVKNREMVDWMAKAGARMVFLGLESASDEILSSYGKGITSNTGEKAVDILKSYGIRVWGSFIVGALDDTLKTIKRTVEYAKKVAPDIAEFSILTPFPGTLLFEQAVKNGLIPRFDWHRFDGAHAVMNTHFLKASQIAKAAVLAYASFYLRPSRLGQIKEALRIYLKGVFGGGYVAFQNGRRCEGRA